MFFMLTLVLANNYLLMFVGWEGVGLASYLLIGFFFLRDSAADAGKKAFIVNRIGDFGIPDRDVSDRPTFRIAGLSTRCSPQSAAMPTAAPEAGWGLFTAIGTAACCLAQQESRRRFALRLAAGRDGGPNAGFRPDPCRHHGHGGHLHDCRARMSSLIMRARCAEVVAIIGALTALFAATIGISQNDIKKRARLLHGVPVGLHGTGLRSGRILRRHLPPDDPRFLQGAALPRCGYRHPRRRRSAGHAAHGRLAQAGSP